MTRGSRRMLAVGCLAWAGSALGALSGPGAGCPLALAAGLAALASRASPHAARWLLAALLLAFAALATDAPVPPGPGSARVAGRFADLEDSRRGLVVTVRPDRGPPVRVLIPKTDDPGLDDWPAGAVPGARIAMPLEIEPGLLPGSPRRGLAASTIVVERLPRLHERVAAVPVVLELAFRRRAAAILLNRPDDDVGGLLLATVAGDARGIGDDAWRALRGSGLAHVAVVSGFNVSIVALSAAFCAAPLGGPHHPRRRAMALAAAGALLLLLPSDPPVTRAACAVVVARSGHLFGRGSPPVAALGAAVAVLLVLEPALARSLSFALTVAATAAIVLAAERRSRAGRLLVFVAPVLATGPILVAAVGRTSAYTLIANVVALPAVLPALGAGWIALVLPQGSPAFDALVAVARASSAWILFVAAQVAAWPGSGVLAATTGPLWLVVHLALLARGLWPRAGPARAAAFALAVLTSLWPLRPWPLPEAPRQLVDVLDAGQGQAVLLAGSGGPVLVDTADDRTRDGTRAVLDQLRARGVHGLAALVVTHADRDHGGGAAEVLSALRVGRFVLPEPALDSPALRPAVREATRRGVPVVALAAGATWRIPGLHIDVLHPASGTWGDDNDAALVLHATLTASGLTALLPADVDEAIEVRLARRGRLRATDVLVAGHHGARTSTSAALLARLQPRLVLVSCGRGNRHGHPHPDTLARLAAARVRWFDTARNGALAVAAAGERRIVVSTDGAPRAVVPRQRVRARWRGGSA